MGMYYVKRAFEVFRKEGPLELANTSINFMDHNTRDKRVAIYTYKNKYKNKFLYECPLKPYDTIKIAAKDVPYKVHHKSETPVSKPHYGGFAQVKDGNWPHNNTLVKFDEYYVKTSFEKRFIDNDEWESTSYYEYLTQERGHKEKKAINRLNNLDDLWESISKNGYLSNYSGPNKRGKYGYKERMNPFVVIGSNGDIYAWDGRHRFCIAQILDIEIPVHVVCRHKQWQELRDDIYKNGLSEEHKELRNHPDIQDIID